MSDVEKYIQQRKQIDSEFSDNFESGYLNFKLEFLLTQAREESGITIEEIAQKLNWDAGMVADIEKNAKSVNISTLEKYIKVLGKQLIFDVI